MYTADAVNQQMPNEAVDGNIAVGKIFASEFKENPQMVCIPLQIIAQNEWAVFELTDPKKFCGCGFFKLQITVFKRSGAIGINCSFQK